MNITWPDLPPESVDLLELLVGLYAQWKISVWFTFTNVTMGDGSLVPMFGPGRLVWWDQNRENMLRRNIYYR